MEEKENKKERILEVAKDLILEKGYGNVSVQQITKEAQISKGSFYTYFDSKAAMLHAIIDEKIAIVEEKDRIFDSAKSMRESLTIRLRNRFRKEEDELRSELIILNLFQNLDILEEEILNRFKEIQAARVQRWKEELHKYRGELSILEEEEEDYALMIMKIIQMYSMSILFGGDCLSNSGMNQKKVSEEELEKKIQFLVKNIMRMLQ